MMRSVNNAVAGRAAARSVDPRAAFFDSPRVRAPLHEVLLELPGQKVGGQTITPYS